MRILAIESSAVTASVAILEDDTLVAEYTINHKMTHSQTLLPMIDEIFSMVQLKPDDVSLYNGHSLQIANLFSNKSSFLLIASLTCPLIISISPIIKIL